MIILFRLFFSINATLGGNELSIDDQPAAGKWQKWEYVNGGGLYCVESVGLHLSSTDTAKLSLGMHTLKVDYLGDNTYAPSQWENTFVVRNP